MAGTVGAIFNGALQLGSAIGISAIGSIQSGVAQTHGDSDSYAGRAAAYWFLFAVVAAEFVAMAVFYRVRTEDTTLQSEILIEPGVDSEKIAAMGKLGSV